MELDLLAAAETESDSESNHSNQDNASGRRSVVTAATAGSEAGWSSPGFSLCLECNKAPSLLHEPHCLKYCSSLRAFSVLWTCGRLASIDHLKLNSFQTCVRLLTKRKCISVLLQCGVSPFIYFFFSLNCSTNSVLTESLVLDSQHFGLWGFMFGELMIQQH